MNKTTNLLQKSVLSTLAAATLCVLFYTFWFSGLRQSASIEGTFSSMVLILLAFLGAILGGFIAFSKKYSKSIRRAWVLISLANLSNCIAEILWFYFTQKGIEPFPSLADVFYLLFYPLLLAGVLSLPYLPSKPDQRLMIGLDMSIVMLVGGMLIWTYILGPVVAQNVAGLSGLVSVAYPLGDFLILAGLVFLIQRDLDRVGRTKVVFLTLSMVATALADLLFTVVQNEGTDIPMVFMNPLWLLSSWAILMAAGWQILYPSVVIKTKQSNFLPLLRNYLVYLAPVLGLSLVINGLGSIIRMDHRLIGTVLLTILLLVLIYSRQAVILHENRQLFQKMENLAITDPLTTLYNRHSFNETIDREINRTNRHGHALSLLIIDVDHFKTYNDNFGHLKGDQMLHDVSLAIKDCTRKTDFLARYGGDEFVLILPETNLEDARWVSEKIQKIVLERLSRDNLSVSIGIALYKPGTTEQALVGEADANLYQQKHLKMVGNNP